MAQGLGAEDGRARAALQARALYHAVIASADLIIKEGVAGAATRSLGGSSAGQGAEGRPLGDDAAGSDREKGELNV